MGNIVELTVTHHWTEKWELELNEEDTEELMNMIEGYIGELHPSRVKKICG